MLTARPGRFAPSFVTGALVALAIWSFLPLGVWWADGNPASYYGAWLTWAWGLFLVALVTALALVLSGGRVSAVAFGAWDRALGMPSHRYVILFAGLLAVLSTLACVAVFSGNPRNVDGFAHLFQARIFLSGRLWAAPPADLANLGTLQMILGPDRWYSQYPPGQSALLAVGLSLGPWWLLNPIVAAVLVFAVYRVARWCAGESVARLTLVFAAISPFVLSMAGSEMSHLSAATLGALAAAAATWLQERPGLLPCALAGGALGLMTAFRPLDAVAAAVPVTLIIWMLARRRVPAFGAAIAGGLVATLPTLAYNAATTGSWHHFGYNVLWGPEHSLGFHQVPWGTPLTIARAFGLTANDLHQLNTYAFDLPIPILGVIAIGLLAGRRHLTPRDTVPVTGILALSGLLFFFWHRDVFYGPRFLFSAVPWYLILAARSLTLLRESGPRGATMAFLIVIGMLVGAAAITPGRLRSYRNDSPVFSLHPDREARRAGISNAVVVIPDGWGTRLIARMWAAGVPVRASSRLYSRIDACTLEEALDNSPVEALPKTLDSLAALSRPGAPAHLTEDQNLRVDPGAPLTSRCLEEVAFDRRYGVLAFSPFLYLNTPDLRGNIVWARDLGPAGNHSLFQRYAGRSLYRYAIPPGGGYPVFQPLPPEAT